MPAADRHESAARGGGRGLALVGTGVVVLVIAFTALPWFAQFPGAGRFVDVHDFLGAQPRTAGLAVQYFAWLGPLLAVASAAVAAAANLPTLALPEIASGSLAGLGAALAGASIAVTFLAIHLRSSSFPVYWIYLTHARAGFYLALVGCLLIGAGSLLAPRR